MGCLLREQLPASTLCLAHKTKQTALGLGTKGRLRLTHPGSFRQPCQKRESQHKSPSPTSLKSHRPSQDSATQMALTNKIIPRATLFVLLVSSCSSGEELPAYNGILQWWWGKWRLSQFVQGGARSWEVVTLHQKRVHQVRVPSRVQIPVGGGECAITERNIPLNELRLSHLDTHQMVPAARTFPAMLAI